MNTIFSPEFENKSQVINPPKIGDILVSTSGYEACIAHFAKVIDVTKSSVKIIRIASKDVYKQGGMDWVSTPIIDDERGEVMTKRYKAYEDSYVIKETSYSNYYLWKGNPIDCYNHH